MFRKDCKNYERIQFSELLSEHHFIHWRLFLPQHFLPCMMSLYRRNHFNKDFILSTQNGISLTIQNLANTLKKICKRAGLPLYNLHTLRHTFATNLIRNTQSIGDLKEVAELLGDSYEVVINTYFHTDSEKKVELIASLDQTA